MEYPNVRPRYGDFELADDSLMVRFAIQNKLVPSEIISAKRLGLCVSGITVDRLVQRIQKDGVQSDKVMVLVGTNNILHSAHLPNPRKYLLSVRGHFEHLKKGLKSKARILVFCTVPFIPKLHVRHPEYAAKLKRLNKMLLFKWSLEENLHVLPLHEVMSISPGLPDTHFYERFYRETKDKKKRVDGVHLNVDGNKVFLYFLDSIFQKD